MKTVQFDFDGVIMHTKKPWKDVYTIQGELVEGMKDFIIDLKNKGFRIGICSARCIDGKSIDIVETFLIEHGIPFDFVGNTKRTCDVFIDDRAINFNGNVKKLEEDFKKFKLWWKNDTT